MPVKWHFDFNSFGSGRARALAGRRWASAGEEACNSDRGSGRLDSSDSCSADRTSSPGSRLLPLALHYLLPDFALGSVGGDSHADLGERGCTQRRQINPEADEEQASGPSPARTLQELSKGTSNLFSWSYTFVKLTTYCYFDYN